MFERGFYFAPDDPPSGGGTGTGTGSGGNAGGNGSGAGESGTASGNGGTGNGGSSDAGKGNGGSSDAGTGGGGSTGTDKATDKPVQFTSEQQTEINRIVARETKKAKTDAKREQDEAKAREEGRFKDLHDSLETRVKTELEPAAALATELSAEVNASIDDEIKSWPDALKKQDPGKDSVKERLAWVRRSRDLAKELLANRKAPDGEHGNGSDAGNSGGDGKKPVQLVSGRYRIPGGKK